MLLLLLCVGSVGGFSGVSDDDNERQMIAETTLPWTLMFGATPVEKTVTGGYFTAALLSNGTVLLLGMGRSSQLSGVWSDVSAGTYELLLLNASRALFAVSLSDASADALTPLFTGHLDVRLACSGFNDFRDVLHSGADDSVEDMCCGSNFALRRHRDGRVTGRGSNVWGVLGPGDRHERSDWVEVLLLLGASSASSYAGRC